MISRDMRIDLRLGHTRLTQMRNRDEVSIGEKGFLPGVGGKFFRMLAKEFFQGV